MKTTLLFCVLFALSIVNAIKLPAQPTVIDLQTAVGSCNDAQDIAIFNKTWTTFSASLRACATNCWADQTCTSNCIAKALGLTSGCANCFGAVVYCTAQNCATYCFIDPTSKECLACEDKYCEAGLVTCTGLPQSQLPPP